MGVHTWWPERHSARSRGAALADVTYISFLNHHQRPSNSYMNPTLLCILLPNPSLESALHVQYRTGRFGGNRSCVVKADLEGLATMTRIDQF